MICPLSHSSLVRGSRIGMLFVTQSNELLIITAHQTGGCMTGYGRQDVYIWLMIGKNHCISKGFLCFSTTPCHLYPSGEVVIYSEKLHLYLFTVLRYYVRCYLQKKKKTLPVPCLIWRKSFNSCLLSATVLTLLQSTLCHREANPHQLQAQGSLPKGKI